MLKIHRNSNLSILGRFGIAPIIVGTIMTTFSIIFIFRDPLAGDAWMALAISLGLLVAGTWAILYGWWLDTRESRQNPDGVDR